MPWHTNNLKANTFKNKTMHASFKMLMPSRNNNTKKQCTEKTESKRELGISWKTYVVTFLLPIMILSGTINSRSKHEPSEQSSQATSGLADASQKFDFRPSAAISIWFKAPNLATGSWSSKFLSYVVILYFKPQFCVHCSVYVGIVINLWYDKNIDLIHYECLFFLLPTCQELFMSYM